MDIIQMTRELGRAIQCDERYINMQAAAAKTDTDSDVQKKIGEFNMLRRDLSLEMAKADKDGERLTQLDDDIRAVYDEIMNMPVMTEFNAAKEEFDKLIKSVNFIIATAAEGGDPITCPETAPTCTGSCASCGGCG